MFCHKAGVFSIQKVTKNTFLSKMAITIYRPKLHYIDIRKNY